MARYALVDTASSKVLNMIEWEPDGGWLPPDGQALAPAFYAGNIGDTWDGLFFHPPAPVVEPQLPTAEERLDAINREIKAATGPADLFRRLKALA